MGLGPPVCSKCQVIGECTEVVINGSAWRCPICLSRDLKESLFTCGISEESLDGNLRFLRFVKGLKP